MRPFLFWKVFYNLLLFSCLAIIKLYFYGSGIDMTKEQILERLRASEGYISGEELSEQLGVSRAAVWKAVNALRDEGYGIDSVTNRGYKLLSVPDILSEAEIKNGLETELLGGTVYALQSVDSTNEEAKRQAQNGAPDGSLIVADVQTGGKGRLGRAWASDPGVGIWMSLLLKPNCAPFEASRITLTSGFAVCRAIRESTGCDAKIKWPNDIVIGSKKVCGILTEMAAEFERVNYIVTGIGINVNTPSFPTEIAHKATSLRLECGQPFSRVILLQAVLKKFEILYRRFLTDLGEGMLDEYKSLCVTLGRRVTVQGFKGGQSGTAVDITPGGELVVEDAEGRRFEVGSGEVVVQGIY